MIVSVNRQRLIELYDTRQGDGGFATALSALSGEEFGLALMQKYFIEQGKEADILPGIPKTGMKSGFRLDGWIRLDGELVQVEVKNWGANALGGRVYDGNAVAGWNQFLAWFKDPGLRKALFPMKPIANFTTVNHASACMWPVMNPTGGPSPWFAVPVDSLPALGFETSFTHLHVFSMAGYLRSIDSEWLDLPLPKTHARMKRLQKLFRLS